MIIESTIGSTRYQLQVLRDSFSHDERCGEAGRHVTSSYSVSVRPVDINGNNFGAAIFSAQGLVPCTVTNGGTTVFTGYIRPYVSTSANGAYADNIELEIMDNTESMHVYVWPESEPDTSRIRETVRQDSTLASNVTYLFGLVGKSCDTSALGDYSMPWFRTAEGDYIDEVIARLLFEYGYDYKWTPNGTAVFFSTFKPAAASGTISDIRNTLRTSRSDDSSDGIIVTYKQYVENPNTLLYSNDNSTGFKRFLGIHTTFTAELTGKYWEGMMHDWMFKTNGDQHKEVTTTDWDFKGSGIKVNGEPLKRSDVYYVRTDVSKMKTWLDDEVGITLTNHMTDISASGAKFWTDYYGFFDFDWTWHQTIYGTVGYAVDSEQRFRVTGSRPEKVDLRYRLILAQTESDPVKQFTEMYAERAAASAVSYSFVSLTEYAVGGYYTLSNSVEGRSQMVRIISRSANADGIYSYEAEGADIITAIPVITTYKPTGYTAPQISAYQQALLNGFNGTEEEYIRSNAEAKILSLELSSQTFVRDFRKTGATTIKLQVLSSGYTGTATLTVVDSMDHDITVTGGEFSIPFSNNLDYVDVTATIGDKTVTKRVSVIDNTQYFKNWGYQESAPTSGTFITGDYYYNTTTKCRYVYSGSAWVYDNSQEKYIRISSVNPYTLQRNDRDSATSQSVEYKADWTGYESVDLKWFIGSVSDGNLIGSGASVTKSYKVEKLSAPTVILCNSSESVATFTHSVIDITDKNLYLGAASNSGALTVNAIDGDFYYDSTSHKPMFRKNGQWVTGTKENVGDRNLFEKMLSYAQRDILSDHVKEGTEISGEYGYFYNLITELLVVNTVVSNDFMEGESGFRLDGNTGTMEAVDALLSGSISVDHSFVAKGVFRTDRFYPERF